MTLKELRDQFTKLQQERLGELFYRDASSEKVIRCWADYDFIKGPVLDMGFLH